MMEQDKDRLVDPLDLPDVPASKAADKAMIVFTPSGRRGQFPVGTTVLQAARTLGVDIDSVCGGRAICGRCQVLLSEGHFSKHGVESKVEHLSGFSDNEREYQQTQPLADGRRLSCSTQILGDVVIDVPSESQVHRQVVRKRVEVHDIQLDPRCRLYFVEVPEPDMHDPTGDLKRLIDALEFEWELENLSCAFNVLGRLQTALRRGEWKVTAAVMDDREIVSVWPGLKESIYGLAVDVGSTTIAAHLCDLSSGEVAASSGSMNPQIRFGEDLMSRVSYVMMNPGGDVEMTRVVRESIQQLAVDVAKEADCDVEDIMEIVCVGNPIMHHLLLGIDPVELGGAPFALATDEAVELHAGDLDLSFNPGARAYILPCIAGHVGADTAGVLLSEAPWLSDEISLIVDVGTNAEIVLGNKQRMLACSSPTGPAFEGAQISGGQRAAPGAIERVRIDRETLEPRFRVIGSEAWSTDPDFANSVASMNTTDASGDGVTGICGSGIIEVIAEMFLSGVISADGVIDGSLADKTSRIVPDGRTFAYVLHEGDVNIRITQNDVRAIQLAKAALYAGVCLLMDHLRIDAVDRIRFAGAFGSHIDVKYAMVLGLIPDCVLDKVTSAGNAAGTGARIALLDRSARQEIESVVRRVEKIETAIEPRFQEHFVNAMAIPHKTDEFKHLSSAVDLPARTSSRTTTARDGERPRRRRRRG